MTDPTRAAGTPVRPAKAPPPFVHLKVHSAYSLLESALPIPRIAKLAEAAGMPAVALTDTNNMYGVLEFSDKMWSAGIQPIAGIALAVDFQDVRAQTTSGRIVAPPPRGRDGFIALLAMSAEGYANLMKLASIAYLGTVGADAPHVTIATIEDHAAGLITLTGGPDGPIDRSIRDGRPEVAEARLRRLATAFPDTLYVELQRHGLPAEARVEPALVNLAYAERLPLVATNECCFATADDFEAHDALLCIADGTYVTEDNRRRLSPEHHFKSPQDMVRTFADLPEAITNTVEIAIRCAYRPQGRKPILPTFVQTRVGASEEEKLAAEEAELRQQAQQGLDERLRQVPLADGFTREDYDKRLAYEVGVIAQMKFPGYFLIVADFIKWSKAKGIPVGPGRGSGAGSLVAWALTITDLDPLRFGLLFERFLNPERISMPDFDIDFCQDRREETIRYVQQKYGADRVAQIITHGKLQARAVLRDVGRVLQMPYRQVDLLCKLVPNNPANPVTLEQAIAVEPKLQEARASEPVVARLLEIAQKLEGLYRHASTHAAGMVIGDRPLDELVPLYRDPKSDMPVTQFNWKMVEAAGLVKFDFLGLKTLTVLQKAVQLVKRGRGVDIDLATVSIENDNPAAKAAYDLLAKADTVGVFQLESTGMRESLKRLKPDRFEDIIAMVALYRPGPMDNIPTYIHRKHGEEPVDCLHPMLEGILKETYGVIIYQEQVIQIAQVMGGYTLGQADLLRRAMGKKDKAEMAKQQARFVEGAIARGVRRDDAAYIFELVDKFAGYGFNKSHAAAYAMVSFHTAYMKANFREEFLAASMTLDLANTDKLAMFAAEARKSAIPVLPPCINASQIDFTVELAGARAGGKEPARGAIRYALAALKNIGAGAVETIVAERGRGGPYKDLSDFARRISPKALNKRNLETLAAGGAFEAIEPNRALVHGNADQILALSNRLASNAEAGTQDLFGAGPAVRLDIRPVSMWTPMERLGEEFKAIGFYLSGHPLDEYAALLPKLAAIPFVEFERRAGPNATSGRLAAIVVSARERRSQKGNKFAFALFSDATGQFEAVIFSDALAASRTLLEPGTAVLLSVTGEREGESLKVRVEGIEALDKAVASVQRGLRVTIDERSMTRAKARIAEVGRHLKSGGNGEVQIVIQLPDMDRVATVSLGKRFALSPAIRGAVSTVPGVLEVADI